jgi:hypothetical protein
VKRIGTQINRTQVSTNITSNPTFTTQLTHCTKVMVRLSVCMYVLYTFPTGGRKGHDFGDLGIKLPLGKIQ